MNKNEIIEKYIKEFPILDGNKEPYIIALDAYNGMGKSTVALAIAKYDNSIILNNDQVRNWLNDYSDKTNLKNEIQKYRLEELLKTKNSCILDSCFCNNWQKKLNYLDKLGYKYFIIRLVCNDEVIKTRLAKRKLDGINYSLANYEDYLRMKNTVAKVDDTKIDFIIDTEKDIDTQVKDFLRKYSLIDKN